MTFENVRLLVFIGLFAAISGLLVIAVIGNGV